MTDFSAFVAPPPSDAPHAAVVAAASACLDRFTAAFNASDTRGMDAELHFPHTMLSGAQRLDWPAPGRHPVDFFDTLKASGWASTVRILSRRRQASVKERHRTSYARPLAGGAEREPS